MNEAGLAEIEAGRAVIAAPFGQRYFDECARRLASSRGLRHLSRENEALVLIVTSKKTRIRPVPGVRIVQIGPVPGWPEHERCQSRFVKWAIPSLFPNIRQSLYVDSDLHITQSAQKIMRLFEEIARHRCVMTKHETRVGWEDECAMILSSKRALDAQRIEDQRRTYQNEGLPLEAPVYQTNFIGRVHGSEFDALSARVLSELLRFSERDQLALPKAIIQTGLTPYGAKEGEFLYSGFRSRVNADTLCFVDAMAAGRFYIAERGSDRPFSPKQKLSERILNKLFFVTGIPGL
jgi:hypothetical protein